MPTWRAIRGLSVADTVDDLVNGMQDMRIKNAILITALRRLGEPLKVTHGDAFDAARFDVRVIRGPGEMIVSLVDAPK